MDREIAIFRTQKRTKMDLYGLGIIWNIESKEQIWILNPKWTYSDLKFRIPNTDSKKRHLWTYP